MLICGALAACGSDGTSTVAPSAGATDAAGTTNVASGGTTSGTGSTGTGSGNAMVQAAVVSTATVAAPALSTWGTALKPFSADSPWNSRPVSPVLSSVGVPTSDYFPGVEEGAFSTGVFVASSTDSAMVVQPLYGSGMWDPDTYENRPSITIARWPASALPASGSDGHCDIIDPVSGVIHSFWQLKNVNGVWRAAQYAWTPLKGRGWGDPAHYYQGARAVGVAALGGLIRKHEVADGDTLYRHALSMSLTFNGLSPSPTYQFPATSADADAAKVNTGQVPQGALLMLPASFDTSTIASAKLRKIAETLKTYGGYVVDRNGGTPFVIYAEIGANVNLHEGSWNGVVASDLDRIRAALRMVASTSSWLDGDGQPTTLQKSWNLLSMRGPWQLSSGATAGSFNTWSQQMEFTTAATSAVTMVNSNGTGLSQTSWAKPEAGKTYKLTSKATGGARLRLVLTNCTDATKTIDSGQLPDAASFQFVWPASYCYSSVYAISGVNQASAVSGELVKLP
jgi:hypothetical protein